jgi:hypothetical protein
MKLNENMVFKLKVSLAESYLYGTAEYGENTFTINIQGGRTGVVLPYDFEPLEEILIHFSTESGKRYSLRSKVEKGADMIEIYDDDLTLRLANDLPILMTVIGKGL